MNLYLIRHGECLGQSDSNFYAEPDSPLSALGQQQAQLTGEYLSHLNLSHVVSSPLVRALETAVPIAESSHLPVEVWPNLREGFSGRHRGHSLKELQSKFPEARFPEGFAENGWQHGDDIYKDWQPRCENVLKRLHMLPNDSHVALVSHGGFGNYLLHSALGLNFKKPHWFELANGSISRLRFVPDPEAERPNWPLYPPVKIEVHSVNEVAHLKVAWLFVAQTRDRAILSSGDTS